MKQPDKGLMEDVREQLDIYHDYIVCGEDRKGNDYEDYIEPKTIETLDNILLLLPRATEEVKECQCEDKSQIRLITHCRLCGLPQALKDVKTLMELAEEEKPPLEWPKKKASEPVYNGRSELIRHDPTPKEIEYNQVLSDCIQVHQSVVEVLNLNYKSEVERHQSVVKELEQALKSRPHGLLQQKYVIRVKELEAANDTLREIGNHAEVRVKELEGEIAKLRLLNDTLTNNVMVEDSPALKIMVETAKNVAEERDRYKKLLEAIANDYETAEHLRKTIQVALRG